VEQICNRVIMIFDGEIRADMPLQEAVGAEALRLKLAVSTDNTPAVLANLAGVGGVETVGLNEWLLQVDGRDETRSGVAATAVNAGWGLLELTSFKPSLETVFLNKMKETELARAEAAYAYEEEE
jgi:ABC-type uncharacterized transport system ATPase subunit